MAKTKNQSVGKNHWMRSVLPLGFEALWAGSRATFAIAAIGVIFWFGQPALASNDPLWGQEQAIITRTNQIRIQAGLPTLTIDPRLMRSAANKANDMAIRGYFDHANPDGYHMSYWINGAGYTYSLAGENLAKGFYDLDRLMNAWVASPGHYKNLVEPEFTDIGVGMAEGWYENQLTLFIVQHFGAPAALTTQNIAALTAPLASLVAPLVEPVAGTGEQQTAINTGLGLNRSASKTLNPTPIRSAPLTISYHLISTAQAQPTGAEPVTSTASPSGAIQFWPIFALIILAAIGYLEEFFPLWSEESSFRVKK